MSEREATQRLAARIHKQNQKGKGIPKFRDAEKKAQKAAERADNKKERR